jgi:hypothetical protein
MPDSTIPPLPPRLTPLAPPPPPVPPPDIVRVRMDVPGVDYRALKRLSIETETSVNGMLVEAVRLLVRWYRAQGIPAPADPGPR